MKRTALLCLVILVIQFRAFAFTGNVAGDSLIVDIATISHATCHGSADGAITLDVQGTPPFSYEWSTGDTNQDVFNLPAGTYDVVVTDSVGAQVSLTGILLTQPDEMQVSLTHVTLPTCNGLLGELQAEAIGGSSGYTYEWNTGDSNPQILALSAGFYSLIVTDANSCTASVSIDLQPQFPSVDIISDGNITCVQTEVRLTGSVGNDNIVYQWTASNGGQFSSDTDTLETVTETPGTYILTATDTLNGCSADAQLDVIEDKAVPMVFAGADTVITCSNQVFMLSGNATNGSLFSYAWTAIGSGNISIGADSPNPSIDQVGTFEMSVINTENGCSAVDTVTIGAMHDAPVAVTSEGSISCIVTETFLSVTADTTGKTFSWSGPNGFISNDLMPLVQVPGIYSFEIVDTTTTCALSIEAEINDNTAPPAIIINDGTLTCAILSIDLDATTTSGDAIVLWTGPNAFVSIELNPSVSESGEYILTITDTLTGCFASASAMVVEDKEAPVADAIFNSTLNCYSPTVQLDGTASSQGAQFSYAWSTTDGQISADENTLNPSVTSAGTYQLMVTNTENGCTATAEVAIQSDFETPIVEAFGGDVSCFEPELLLISNFDTLDVVFSWTGPQGYSSDVQNPMVTLAGEYLLTVTDTLNGCAGSAIATVDKLGTDPKLTLSGGILTCSLTQLQLTAEADIDGIVWSWASDNGFTSTDKDPMVTMGGWYTALAIDTVFGCIGLDSVFVEMDTLTPAADAGAGLAFNCNISSAILSASASIGTEFTYAWSTADGNIASGETSLNPTVDAPGTYTLTVVNNNNGCVNENDVVISQTPPIELVLSSEDAACNGTATGSASVTIIGGTGNFTSTTWSSGSTSINASDLVAGDYIVTVTDMDGCTAVSSVSISQPDVLIANAAGVGQSLAGIDDGVATAIGIGGTLPYTFEWDNGATTETITDLAPGAYTVTITDAKGCREIATANVNEFLCVLQSSISGSDAICHSSATGTASVELTNEIAPLQFIWSSGDTLATAQNLFAGIYTVTISDSTNCQNILTIEVKEPPAIQVAEVFHIDVQCPEEAIGFVIVGANGGMQPYQYAWSNGSTTNVANGLSVGSYTLTLTDASECESIFTTTISATDSEAPNLLLQDVEITLDENGVAQLSTSQVDAGTTDNCGAVSLEIDMENFDCSQIGAQTVFVVATDSNGNQSTGTVSVTVTDDWVPVLTCPTDIVVSACDPEVDYDLPSVTDNCTIDMAQLEQTTGLPSGAIFPIGLTAQSFIYTDLAGNVGECSFEIVIVEEMEVANSFVSATCAQTCNGSANLAITGGIPPYAVTWAHGATEASLSDLCAGMYAATITDAGGCVKEVSFEIEEPTALGVAIVSTENNYCPTDTNGSLTVEANGGTGSYTYTWSNGLSGATIDGLPSGTYQVTATDDNGCEHVEIAIVTSTDDEAPALALQNAVLNLGATGSITLDPAVFDAGSTDNCGIASWSVSPSNLDCSNLGETTVTITAMDGSGNATSSTVEATLLDNTAPTLNCPANITFGFCNPTVTFSLPQVVDNCSVDMANLVQTEGLLSGAIFPLGTTTQSYQYTDQSGNEGECSFTVTVLDAAILTAQNNDISCAAECDGEINLEIFGAAGPYVVQWNDGQTGQTAVDLCSGPHSATITDAFGCLQSFTTVLTAPAPLIMTLDEVQHDANNAGVGSIDITVVGGTPPYAYEWVKDGDQFAVTQDLSGLTAGSYEVTVYDANGCEVASSTIVIDNTTGTSEANWATGMNIQPNPAKDWTTLKLSAPLTSELNIRLFDLNGKMVNLYKMNAGETERTLNLEAIPSGIYTVQLNSGEKAVTTKIIIGN